MQIHDAAALGLKILEWVFLVLTLGGSVYMVCCLLGVIRLRTRAPEKPRHTFSAWPPVSILKPICGLEKGLRENLRSTCQQDYPDFQVVFSVQELDDPAIPLLKEIQQEFGPARVSVAIENRCAGTNGKINNLIGGLPYAKHDILVISDSDVRLRPDYLKTIVAPLADPEIGAVCTLYKAAGADKWYEKIELLTLNADLVPNMIFAHVTGASKFLLGASTALRRSKLQEMGGLEALADYLVEDYEMGRRIWESGQKVAVVPYQVDTIMDLADPSKWWGHQVYWDQNSRAARPIAYLATVFIRPFPFALFYAILRLGDHAGLAVLAGALLLRLVTAAIIVGWGFRDREGLRSLWLLPFRDLVALVSWVLAYTKRTTVWRGKKFVLTHDGRLVAREAKS